MERYNLISLVGEGSFGRVYKAIDTVSRRLVAIKELLQCDPMTILPEVRALSRLEHPKIVSFKKLIHQDYGDFLVFEFMEGGSLGDLISRRRKNNNPFSEAEIRSLIFQVLKGLDFMHRRGYMHRDLKPDNLLMNQGVIKISDLGLATEIDPDEIYQQIVGTRWYKAPELLRQSLVGRDEKLRPFNYGEKVDMWAMGAIMAELFLMCPLFMGDCSAHQLYMISKVIGAPTTREYSWKGPQIVPDKGIGFQALIPYASQEAIDLVESLCSWDPSKRPSARQAIQHPFFNVGPPPGFSNFTMNSSTVTKMTVSTSTMQQQPILGV